MKSINEYIGTELILKDLVNKVYNRILEVASDSEISSIELNKFFPTTGVRFIADIYTDKGIKDLGWVGKTVIEVKSYIDSRSLSQIYRTFKKIEKDINRFVLIYHKTNFSSVPSFEKISNKFIMVDYDDFIYWERKNSEKGSRNNGNEEPDKKKNTPQQSGTKESKRCDTVNPKGQEPVDWKSKRDLLLENLKNDILEDEVTLFLGAGVSASANMPSWERLLHQLLTKYSTQEAPKYLDCDFANVLASCGNSYLIAARYINSVIDEAEKAKIIQGILYAENRKSTLIDSICHLVKERRIDQIITTNYDQLVEQGLKEIGVKAFPVTHTGIIPKNVETVVYHVHGSVNDPKHPVDNDVPDAPVLSEEDYHALYATGHHWSNTAILHAFQHSHCVFIGLSMTDPNLRRLLEYTHMRTQDEPHYVFLCRRSLYEGYYEKDERNLKHFEVQERLMASLGIQVIWYELDPNAKNPHHEVERLIAGLSDSDENNAAERQS